MTYCKDIVTTKKKSKSQKLDVIGKKTKTDLGFAHQIKCQSRTMKIKFISVIIQVNTSIFAGAISSTKTQKPRLYYIPRVG